ncbi:MAG: FAD-binding oxidoreductase [Alphaproteobacteria bacterium]
MARIADVVGPKGVVRPEDTAPYLADQRGLYRGQAALIVRPSTVHEVSEIVKLCAAARVPIVPQGGNTGLVGGAIAGENELLLNLGRLNRIRSVDPLNNTLTAEAGCVLADIQTAADEADRLFPLTMASEGSCQIGGVLSTNAGGTAVLRYGTARDLVLGLEVVLADGRVLDVMTGLRKDNTGYDLKQLFLGAEGTLGIITAAVLKLFPKPREIATAFVALRDLDAAPELLARARAVSNDSVIAFELLSGFALSLVLRHIPGAANPLSGRFEQLALIEMATADADAALGERFERLLGAALSEGLIRDAAVALNETQRQAFWRLRESLPEAQKREGASIKHDVAVPVSAVPAFIARATEAVELEMEGIRVVAFGHAGDGNIHFNLTKPEEVEDAIFLARWMHFNRIVHDVVREFGGTISAEHGIGRLKREELVRTASPLEIEVMRRLKATLDPLGLLNPGKIF